MPKQIKHKQQDTDTQETPEIEGYFEQLVELKRTSKKTKGGNRFRFSALVVVGDQDGKVGFAVGKAKDVGSAIKKGSRQARKRMIEVQLVGNAKTIAHDVKKKYKSANIVIKPAPQGTGIIAGGSLRTIAQAAGIKSIVCKIIGTNNKKSNVQAMMGALKSLKPSNTKKLRLSRK